MPAVKQNIKNYKGKIFVVKISGKIIENKEYLEKVVKDLVFLRSLGTNILLIHGGGKQIDTELEKAGIEKKIIHGLRYTDLATLKIMEKILGQINKGIVQTLTAHGAKAVGIDNVSRAVLFVKKKKAPVDYGLVGTPQKVDTALIKSIFAKGCIPVVSCLGKSKSEGLLNVNADEAAVGIAKSLKAEKLMIVSDVPGILRDKSNKSTLITSLTPKEAKELIANGTIDGGMIPKALMCIEALNSGISSIHLIDGTENSILEGISDKGKGTAFRK